MTELEVEIVEPTREVVEVVEPDGTRTVYVVEPTIPQAVPQVLADLDDVAAAAPSDGQALVWDEDAGLWQPGTVAAGGDPAGTFVHTQSVPATVWGPISHGLGARPAAVALFSADYGTQFDEFTVQHLSDDQLRISMDIPTAGKALIR